MCEFDDEVKDSEQMELIQEWASDGKVMLYVEGAIDCIHWRKILECAGVSAKFEVSLYGQSTGKASLLTLLKDGGVHKNAMIAIDADLDYLFDLKENELNNLYVHHTYVYGIEGIILHKNIIKAFIERILASYSGTVFNYDNFLREYSNLCYQVLIWIVAQNITTDFNKEFVSCCLVKNSDGEYEIPDLSARYEALPNYKEATEKLILKGVNSLNAYRYISGHVLDSVIMNIIKSLEDKIISAEHTRLTKAKDEGKINITQFKNKKSEIMKIIKGICNLESHLCQIMPCANDDIVDKICKKIQRSLRT